MSNKMKILERLRATGVPFELYEHEAAHTIAACYELPFAQDDVTICKNMLLTNTRQSEFILYITHPDKRFRTGTVSKLLGTSRLQFAPESALMERLGVTSGSLAPFGLWEDEEHGIRFAVDNDVRKTNRIAFHPCDNTATVVFLQEDFFGGLVPELGVKAEYLEVPIE